MESEINNKVSSGSLDLNKWLFGGYDKDIATTLYGPAGSGKTNFCIAAAVSTAKKGGKVIFIDTEGGFSVERLKQICEKSDCDNILNNILLLKPTTFAEQEQAFVRLLKEIKEQSKISLIIIDGMTMLYRLDLAEARKSNKNSEENIDFINSKLAMQMRIFSEIARKKNIPVLVTNQVYYNFLSEEDFRTGKEKNAFMVGGDILMYWSKCIIELKKTNGKRTAILRKHRSLPESEFNFEIVNSGIRKKSWL